MSIVIKKQLKKYIIAAIISMSSLYFNGLVDGILISKFINPIAFSAIGAIEPIFMLISMFSYLLSSGAGVLLGKAIGAEDHENINQRFTAVIVSLILGGGIVSLIGGIYSDQIILLFCTDMKLFSWAYEYGRIILMTSGLQILSQGLCILVSVGGYPTIATKANVVSVAVNIIGDIITFVFGNYGIVGAALSLLAGIIAANLILIKFFLVENNIYSLVKCRKLTLYLKENIMYGFPDMMAGVSDVVISIIIIQFVQYKLGASGMFALSVALSVINFGFLIINCISNAFMNIGSRLVGQKNYDELRIAFYYCAKLDFIIVGIIFIICCLYGEDLAILYGADSEELKFLTTESTKNILGLFIGIVFASVVTLTHQIVGEIKLSQFESIILVTIVAIVIYILEPNLFHEYVWEVFYICGLLSIISIIGISEIVRKKSKMKKEFINLLPK